MEKLQKPIITRNLEVIRVKFEHLDRELNMSVSYCTNPNCTCKESTLRFFDTIESKKNEIAFSVKLNYENWEIKTYEVYREDVNCLELIDELRSSMCDEIKEKILSLKGEFSSKDDIEKLNIDYLELQERTVVHYNEIFQSEQFLFEYTNISYIVVDYYCSNHKCTCNDVLLDFLVVKENVARDIPTVKIRLSFRNGKHKIEMKDDNVTNKYADELYEEFLKLLGNKGIKLLKERYDKLGQWRKEKIPYETFEIESQTYMPYRLSGPKIGRNEPCPCGSGKKYKKCCGV